MANRINVDIVIVGAGLTGLTTGFYLNKYGKKVALLEKASRTGGVINSVKENGFVYETGPNSGVLSSVEAVELFEDIDDKELLETANEKSKKRLIWKGDSWHPLPSGPISAISTPLFTFGDKLRILGEPFRKAGENPEECVADLVKRRLGKSFLDYAVDPFISGIYAGDPQKIITKYALPKLYDLEHTYGSFIRGSIKKKKTADKSAKKATREVFSTKGGLRNLIDSLTKSIGNDNIFLNCEGLKINVNGDSYISEFNIDDEEFEVNSDKVITTTGAHALPELLPFIPENGINNISNLKYAKVVQVILGFNKWAGTDLNAFGGLVPSIEKRNILGVLYSSSIFTNRAPKGGALLSIFMGGTKNQTAITKTDDEITEIVKGEILSMMDLPSFGPDLLRIFRYQNAIPQYEVTSGKRFEQVEILEKKYPGLILAGNLRNGIGMSDRIKQGRTIADSLK